MPTQTEEKPRPAIAEQVAQWFPVPLTGDPYANVDEVELSDTSPVVQDAYVDEFGYTVKRPGLTSFVDLGTSRGIDGLYWWDQQSVAIAISDGRVWKITDSAGTKTELTGTTLSSGTPVSFATNGTTLAMANGTKIVLTPLAGPLANHASPNAPTDCTHVGWVDGYLLFNHSTANTMGFSAVDDINTIAALDFVSAEGKPDLVNGLYVAYREVYLLGRESVEIWVNDGVTPFSRLPGAFIERGVSSPYAFCKVSDPKIGDAFMFLDDKRRFVKLFDRIPVYISNPFDKLIQSFLNVDNAVANVMEVAGYPFYIINFPVSNVTLAYNFQKERWTRWGYWDPNVANYRRYRGNTYCYARPWNLHLVGDWSNGIIYKSDRTMFDDNGSTIRTYRRTGYVTHGTMNKKRSRQMRIRCKRGVATASVPAPTLILRWRNMDGAWSADHSGNLGAVGDSYFEVVFDRLGEYRARQYELIHTDATDFIVVDAKELVQVGPR